jgi:hypothetical protein
MNQRIKELAEQARNYALDEKRIYERMHNTEQCMEEYREMYNKKFAELIVEATLDQVKERAYYTGDRDWSDEVDRPWIQLEFGYGTLADAQKGIFK